MKKVLSVFFAVLFVFMFIVPAFAANNRFIYSEKDGGYIDTETGILYTNAGRGGVGAPIIDKNGEPVTVSAKTIEEAKTAAEKMSSIATVLIIAVVLGMLAFLAYLIYTAIRY